MAPTMGHISEGSAQGRGDNKSARIADGQVSRHLQQDYHQRDSYDAATNAEKGAEAATDETHPYKVRIRNNCVAFGRKIRFGKKHAHSHSHKHCAEQTLEPGAREERSDRAAEESSQNTARRQPKDLMPVDIAMAAVHQGAAYCCGNDNGQTGTKSQMNNYVVVKAD